MQETFQNVFTAATDNSAGNNWFMRQAGGTTGQIAKQVEAKITLANQQSPAAIAGFSVWLDEKFKGKEDSPEAKRARDIYNKYVNGDSSYTYTTAGIRSMMHEISPNDDITAAYNYSLAPAIVSMGYNANKELLAGMPSRVAFKDIERKVHVQLGQKGVDKLHEHLTSGGAAGDIEGLIKDPYFTGLGFDFKGAAEKFIFSEYINTHNKKAIEHNALIKEDEATSGDFDAQTDRIMGMARPEILTRLAQGIASGSFADNGFIETLKTTLGVGWKTDELGKYISENHKLISLKGANTVNDAANIVNFAGAGDVKTNNLANIKGVMQDAEKYGIQTKNLEAISKLTNPADLDALLSKNQGDIKSDEERKQIIAHAKAFVNLPEFRQDVKEPDGSIKLDATGKPISEFAFDTDLTDKGITSYIYNTERSRVLKNITKSRRAQYHTDKLMSQHISNVENNKNTIIGGDNYVGAEGIKALMGATLVTNDESYTASDKVANYLKDIRHADIYDLDATRGAATYDDIDDKYKPLIQAFASGGLNGWDAINKNYPDIANQFSTGDIGGGIKALGKKLEDSSTGKQLLGIESVLDAQDKDVQDKYGKGGTDLSGIVKDILTKLESLPAISSALQNVAAAIKTN
jgi:hypothetical protein